MESGRHAVDMGGHYVIQPDMDWWQADRLAGTPVPEGFSYSSHTNPQWLSASELREIVATLDPLPAPLQA